MSKWLSILIPSNRPEGLERYIDSLRSNADNFNEIEIVILVDEYNKPPYVEMENNIIVLHHPSTKPVNISELQNECYRVSTGKWIMLGNDDSVMTTPRWDTKIKEAVERFPDEIALIYPNDKMFGEKLACFPVVSRKLLEAVQFFPQPYRRYKVDDTLFGLFPTGRRVYLSDVEMPHLNDNGKPGSGFRLENGKYYPIDQVAAVSDQVLWDAEQIRRHVMGRIVEKMIYSKDIKVMICVPTAEFARRADFYDYFQQLQKPEGTMMTFAHGQSPAKNRNIMIRAALEQNCTHILFIDDDMTFKPTILLDLLAHDKDIVGGIYLMRNYPHLPVMFDEAYPDGRCRFEFLKPGLRGLHKCVNMGLGMALIKTSVFKKMKEPWITLGETEADQWGDDIAFFNRARKAGFDIYIDLDCQVGHIITAIISPSRLPDGTWTTVYNTGAAEAFQVPQHIGTPEQLAEATRVGQLGIK